jgi:hypothetical protein
MGHCLRIATLPCFILHRHVGHDSPVGSGLFSERHYARDKVAQSAYSRIKHLAGSLFLNRSPEDTLMTMLTAYFDESGTHNDSPAVAVAGYISTVDQWQRFEAEWQAILDDAGISFFHMTDHQNRQGPYKDWDDFKYKRILERLILTIRLRTWIAVGATVSRVDYYEVFSPSPPFNLYTFCALQCLSQVSQWANEFKRHEPIEYVLEDGAGYTQELHVLRNEISKSEARRKRFRFHSLSTADKRTMVPLQAADVLAYEIYRDMKNRILPEREDKQIRGPATALLDGRPRYVGHYTKEQLLSPISYISPERA